MPEDVMEDVGLLNVIKLFARSNEVSGGESPIGEMEIEYVVRDQHRDGHHGPSGQTAQLLADFIEVRDSPPMQVETSSPNMNSLQARPGISFICRS